MRALLTEQGTAASETALCLDCFEVPEHVQWARDRADSDVDPDGFFEDCTGNEELECQNCGWVLA